MGEARRRFISLGRVSHCGGTNRFHCVPSTIRASPPIVCRQFNQTLAHRERPDIGFTLIHQRRRLTAIAIAIAAATTTTTTATTDSELCLESQQPRMCLHLKLGVVGDAPLAHLIPLDRGAGRRRRGRPAWQPADTRPPQTPGWAPLDEQIQEACLSSETLFEVPGPHFMRAGFVR